QIVPGARRIAHPVRPAGWRVSIERQRGNAADARMRMKHGRDWRQRARAGRGRFGAHLFTTVAATTAVAGFAAGRKRVGIAGAVGWTVATGQFAWQRIAPGPRTAAEI